MVSKNLKTFWKNLEKIGKNLVGEVRYVGREEEKKEGDTKNEEDTLPEPTEIDEGAKDKAEPEQVGSSDTTEANLTSNPKQSLGVDPVVHPLLTGSRCIFKLIYDFVSVIINYSFHC